ncbi:MAG TPA: helix-turn-helix transcriptional regulator [Saprospiraceae bacterium]|jgi:hypothetical protein|nr:helix-turn-helix transcriptional regulator [Saprospiraceae bacterium]HRF41182.1 helix-turn-helix transcriptional regulator [Saprospiraceae bacterium]HRK81548.1 helix-turn-helix transcriptional regulator [Saprospiraceae bacterium]
MQEKLQQQLLDRILDGFPRKPDAVDALRSLLNVSKDAIYRRLRGDSLLSPSEVALLARHFHISLDELVHEDSDRVYFSFSALNNAANSVEDYLLGLHQNLHQLEHLPDVKVYYTTSEIPIFYYFLFEELAVFKLYIWGRSAWDFDYLKHQPFDVRLISPHAVALSREILDLYFRLDTTELWSINIFDNTLNQIEHHFLGGAIAAPEQALSLCDRLTDLAAHLQMMAAQGKKFKPRQSPDHGAPFALLHNDSLYTNSTIFVDAPHLRRVFSTFGDPDYLVSSDGRICDFTDQWLQRLIGKSVPISAQSEGLRLGFFHQVRRKIEATKRRILAEVDTPVISPP